MLLRFSVTNHGALRDRQELSLVAADKHEDLPTRPIPASKESVLPVVGMFGANASGKSTVVDAFHLMYWLIAHSHQRLAPTSKIPRRPFRLDTESPDRPTEFSVDFALGNVRYAYHFAFLDDRFTTETLRSYPEGKPRLLFARSGDDSVKFGNSFTGSRQLLVNAMRPNSLFLSVAAANNHQLLGPIYKWFRNRVRIATDENFDVRLEETIHVYEKHERDTLLQLIRYADLGVSGMRVMRRKRTPEEKRRFAAALLALDPDSQQQSDSLEFDEPPPDVELIHRIGGQDFELDLDDESSGTRTWIGIIGPVLSALRGGAVLIIDELDARLHSKLADALVGMFQHPEVNPRGAQLIFNSHDASLLGPGASARLRRDQVWFTEKDSAGAVRLFPLMEYRIREGLDNVEKSYLRGRYGAVPFLDDELLDFETEQAAEI